MGLLHHFENAVGSRLWRVMFGAQLPLCLNFFLRPPIYTLACMLPHTRCRVVVRGSGPLGQFTATISGVSMKGRMRVLPIPEQRMLLWSFLQVGCPDSSPL